jgi:hypothetical protein
MGVSCQHCEFITQCLHIAKELSADKKDFILFREWVGPFSGLCASS